MNANNNSGGKSNREKENAYLQSNTSSLGTISSSLNSGRTNAESGNATWNNQGTYGVSSYHKNIGNPAVAQLQSSKEPPSGTSKFSSWNTSNQLAKDAPSNYLDNVDELLMYEQDQQAQKLAAAGKSSQLMNYSKIVTTLQKGNVNNIESEASLSNSLEFDSYDDIEDEVSKGLAAMSKQSKIANGKSNAKSRQGDTFGTLEDYAVLTDSMDFENSDDLNKIIQKYETMLASSASKETPKKDQSMQDTTGLSNITPKQKLAQLKSRLEESWGSHEKLIEELQYANKPVAAILEENYDEDFEKNDEIEDEMAQKNTGTTANMQKDYQSKIVAKKLSSHTQPHGYEDDEDEKIVDEEFNLTSSSGSNSGKRDSDFLNELMKPPIRTKIVANISQPKLSSNIKAGIHQDPESSGEYGDEIDEFIKKHYETEEKEKMEAVKRFSSAAAPITHNDDSSEGEDDLSDSEGGEKKPKISPKEHLIQCLQKLSDTFGKYSLTDREMLLSDLESILKILTYQEIVDYIIPILDIYSTEQEFLKLQFFQKLPFIFIKLLSNIPKTQQRRDTLQILTEHVFPVIQKMMINSEEQVQSEGVDALCKVSKECFTIEEAQTYIFDLVQLIMDEAEHNEGAKIAALMLVERFADQDIFKEEECNKFLELHLSEIQKGMLFKIKKCLLPMLLAASKHLTYDRFIMTVYSTFMKFSLDDIWGVRKVCLERLHDLVKCIKPNDIQKLRQCLDFLQASLKDQSRWVKNQAFQLFGVITNEIYEKSKLMTIPSDQVQIRTLITMAFDIFYDPMMIQTEEDTQMQAQLMLQSFTANQNDDVDKVKYYWAYFIPCSLVLNGGNVFWESKIRDVFQKLYKDVLVNVRKSLAAGMVEIMKLVDMESKNNQKFFIEALKQFTSADIPDVKAKIAPQLCSIVNLYKDETQTLLLNTFIKENLSSTDKQQKREHKMNLLEQVYDIFPLQQLADSEFHIYLEEIIAKEQGIQLRKKACKLYGKKVVAPFIKGKKLRKPLTTFVDNLRTSKNFRERQLYLVIARATFKTDPEIFKKHFAKAIGSDMITDKVKVVQIILAKICREVDSGYSKSIDKVRSELLAKGDQEITQFIESSIEDKKRYLSSSVGEDLKSQNGEEEKKENDPQKEQENLEKTVVIKFANFSTLVKQQSLGASGLMDANSLFNHHLMAIIGGFLNMGSEEESEGALLKKKASAASEILDKTEEALFSKKSNGGGINSWES